MNLFHPLSVLHLRYSSRILTGLRPHVVRYPDAWTWRVLNFHTRTFRIIPSLGAPKSGKRIPVVKSAYFKLRTNDLNETIYKIKQQNTTLDKVTLWILKKNIMVPAVSLKYSQKYYWSGDGRAVYRAVKEGSLPEEIKVGGYTPLDDEIMRGNLREITEAFKIDSKFLKKKMFFDELFAKVKVDDTFYAEKVNIVGHFVAKGLQNERIASEVFKRCRLLCSATTGSFSAEEDEIIMKFMDEEEKDYKYPYLELSRRLHRTSHSVRDRYIDHLKHQDKEKRGHYSMEENKVIMEALLDHNKNQMQLSVKDKDVIEALATRLNRPPENIIKHWFSFIQPLVTRHRAGVLDVDFRHILINHCVENRILYSQDADWATISKDPKFKGTTSTYLSLVYKSVKNSTKRRYPTLTNAQVTSEALQNFLQNHGNKCRGVEEEQKKLVYFLDEILMPFSHKYIKNKNCSKSYDDSDSTVDDEDSDDDGLLEQKILKLLNRNVQGK